MYDYYESDAENSSVTSVIADMRSSNQNIIITYLKHDKYFNRSKSR
jgi:hypothetical protein